VFGSPTGDGGVDYANLQVGIQGGSGGSASGRNSSNGFAILGGSGGGGIELGASNTVVIASTGQVLADGSNGRDGFLGATGGGGGAGGNILIHATNVHNAGLLSAKGGAGGAGIHTGGGGAAGDIMVVSSTIGTYSDTGIKLINGGAGGGVAAAPGEDGDVAHLSAGQALTPVYETFSYSIDWGDGSGVVTGSATVDTPGVNIGDIVHGSFDGSHTFADNGVYTVTLTVTDSHGGSDTKTLVTTVNNSNPTLTVDDASVAINEGQTATNSGTYGDVPADTVSVAASIGSITFSGGVWNWSYSTTDDAAPQNVTITATDEDGGLTVTTFSLAVNNLAPTLTVDNASVTVDEGQTATNSGMFGDVPADTVNVAASIGSVTFSGGVWNWSYSTTDDAAPQSVTITATDEDGGSTNVSFNLTVNNVAPTLAISGGSDVNEGASYTLNLASSDPGADTISSWTINWGDGSETVTGNPTSVTHIYADGNALSNYTISATATDEDGTYAAGNTVAVSVNNVDPTITVDNASVTVDEGQTATNSGTFDDVAADTVSLTASVGTVTGSAGAWSWSYDSTDDLALTTVTITATDEDGGSSNVTFDLTVNNLAPTLTVDSASVTVDEGQTATNSGTFDDVAADTVSLTASVGTVTGSAGNWSWSSATTDNAPTQSVTITATDGDGGLTSVTFDLTVDNLDPTLSVNDATVAIDEGQTATNSGNYGDVPADTVSVTASIGSVVFTGGVWNWSYTSADNAPTQTVTITATDEDGGLTNVTFDLTVNNVAPSLTVDTATITIDEGQTATNSGTYGDVPADTVSVVASIGTVTFAGGVWSWSYNGTDDLTTTSVTITASDDDGASTSVSFNLTVDNVDPSLTADSATVTVNEGQTATNTGTFGDVAADMVTLSASIGTVTGSAGNWSWSDATTDNASPQTVTITASDEDGGSTSVTFTLTVNNVAPTLAISGGANVNEGSTYTLNLSSSDPGADTISSWTINWGDGNTQVVSGNPSSVTHVYADGNATSNFTITATATDEDGTYAAGNTVAMSVNNVAPTANAGGPYATFDDTPIVLTGSATDPAGAADPLTYTWDLDGDGIFGETGSGATRGNEDGQSVTYNPAGLPVSTQTVKLRVSDGDGGVTTVDGSVQVIGQGTVLSGGVLYIVGGNANDIVIITQYDSTIIVLATFNSSNPMTFAAASVTEIVVKTRNGNDIVATVGVDKTMSIDGGSGNDMLTGGSGRNVIMGGTGNDVLYGADGDDVLLGGDGNDDLFGGNGNDVLVGGDGNDVLEGGNGRDVLIGSRDNDTIRGGNDEDILIGGWTVHDNNVAALDAVMAIWKSSASFNSRVATLSGSGGLLQGGVTVFDDDDNDNLNGNAGRDLIFGDTYKWDGAIDQISLQTAQDILVAVN
jgi:Ca2+-binding RTX toxin-like protein